MGPTPALDPNSYGGQPLELGNLQHEQHNPQPGPVPGHFLNAHTRAGTAVIVSVFPVFRYRNMPLVGQLLLLLPPAARDKIRARKMRPEIMANAVQDPRFANKLPWVDQDEISVPRGQGYSTLTITDSFQWILDITETQKHNYVPAPIPARNIAEGLVAEWVSGLASGGGRAGIGVWDPAGGTLEEFVRQLRAMQEVYFRELVMAGDLNFARTGQKEITDIMRLAADWLGTEKDWNKTIEEVILKRCPACTAKIPQEALLCRNCRTDLPHWYQTYNFPGVEVFAQDPHVGKFMQDRGMIRPVEVEVAGASKTSPPPPSSPIPPQAAAKDKKG